MSAFREKARLPRAYLSLYFCISQWYKILA